MRIIINYKTREGRKMLNRFVYDVYDNNTDMPIIIGGSADECARAIGVKVETFRSYVKKHRHGKYTVIKTVACELDDTFGSRLKMARYANGLTRDDLSRKAKCAISSIRNYELGTRVPDIDTAVRLARALGVSIRYLAGEKKGENNDNQ